MQRHEIPTHLAVEDKAVLGLTMRQLLTAAVSLALAYGAAGELPLPLPARLVIAGVVLAAGALVTLWRPAGRPLEVWAFVLLQYSATARIAVWRAGDSRPVAGEGETAPPVIVRLPTRLSPATASRLEAEGRGIARRIRDA